MFRTSHVATIAGLAAALVTSAAPALAQTPYTGAFRGSTTGCFDNSAPHNCVTPGQTDNLEGLRFTGLGSDSFLGNVTNGSGTISLGTMQLFDHSGNGSVFGFNAFDPGSFRLFVNVTTPGAGSDVYTAMLDGSFDVQWFVVTDDNDGQVAINFGGPQLFNYTTANGSGSFMLEVNDVTATIECGARCGPGENPAVQLTGQITQAQFTATPEPATIALLATGLVAVGGVGAARRRRATA